MAETAVIEEAAGEREGGGDAVDVGGRDVVVHLGGIGGDDSDEMMMAVVVVARADGRSEESSGRRRRNEGLGSVVAMRVITGERLALCHDLKLSLLAPPERDSTKLSSTRPTPTSSPSSLQPHNPTATPPMSTSKSITALQPFLLLSKSATGRAAADLIVQATSAADTFVFSELLECPTVAALKENQDGAPYYRLLELFAYGTWADYQGEFPRPKLPPSSPLPRCCLFKLSEQL